MTNAIIGVCMCVALMLIEAVMFYSLIWMIATNSVNLLPLGGLVALQGFLIGAIIELVGPYKDE